MGKLRTALAMPCWDLCGNNLEWIVGHFSVVTAILSNLSTLDESRRTPVHQIQKVETVNQKVETVKLVQWL